MSKLRPHRRLRSLRSRWGLRLRSLLRSRRNHHCCKHQHRLHSLRNFRNLRSLRNLA